MVLKINYLVKLELSAKEFRSVILLVFASIGFYRVLFVIASEHRSLASLAVRFPHGKKTKFISLVTLLSEAVVKRSTYDILTSQTC